MMNKENKRSSRKRRIKNNQQCAHTVTIVGVCLLSSWHLEIAGRAFFLGSTLFSYQFVSKTLSTSGEGKVNIRTATLFSKNFFFFQSALNKGENIRGR